MVDWSNAILVKALDYNINWFRLDGIEIIASEGDMSRAAIDAWASLLREIIESKSDDETLFIVLDLTGPKQATTPYSMQITRGLAQYIMDSRKSDTYAAVLMKNDFLVGIIRAFFSQYFARQEKLIYRLFTKDDMGLDWLRKQIERLETTNNGTNQKPE